MIEFIESPGLILGVFGTAWGLWVLGLRDEFILTAISVFVGGPLGVLAERVIIQLIVPESVLPKQPDPE